MRAPDYAGYLTAAPRAVFRGSATGYGVTPETNVRLRLHAFAQLHSSAIDFAFTAVNCRDKLLEHGTKLDFVQCGPAASGAFMSLSDQAARFRYVIYADGHCAANRYGALMRLNRTILKIASSQDADCGQQWLFPDLRGTCVSEAGDVADDAAEADHFVIHPDLRNLVVTINILNQRPELGFAVACNAGARAPTPASITAAWSALANCINAAQVPVDASEAPGSAVWFSPYEPAYAALGASVLADAAVVFTHRVR